MFDRFAIVQAYYLYIQKFSDYIPVENGSGQRVHGGWRHISWSPALLAFSPSLTLRSATWGAAFTISRRIAYGQRLPKNDDYQSTRDAYARLLRRVRTAYRTTA